MPEHIIGAFRRDQKANREQRFPKPGELIRNSNTSPFVNIVIEVIPIDEGRARIRSVRYATVKNGGIVYLNGQRSRSFEWSLRGDHSWSIVFEAIGELYWISTKNYKFKPSDNSQRRDAIVAELKDKQTQYQSQGEQNV